MLFLFVCLFQRQQTHPPFNMVTQLFIIQSSQANQPSLPLPILAYFVPATSFFFFSYKCQDNSSLRHVPKTLVQQIFTGLCSHLSTCVHHYNCTQHISTCYHRYTVYCMCIFIYVCIFVDIHVHKHIYTNTSIYINIRWGSFSLALPSHELTLLLIQKEERNNIPFIQILRIAGI